MKQLYMPLHKLLTASKQAETSFSLFQNNISRTMQKSTLSFITKSLFALLFLVSIHTQQASAQCLVNENFEGSFPPSGWQASNGSGSGSACNYNWMQGTSGSYLCSGNPTVVAHSGTHIAGYES